MVPGHQTQGLGPSQPVAGRSLRERFDWKYLTRN
jgi:hypothetical protein